MRATNLAAWMDVYRPALRESMAAFPDDYMPGVGADTVADRMAVAFEKGSYNHDGRACRLACKRLGFKHTRRNIEAFLKGAQS